MAIRKISRKRERRRSERTDAHLSMRVEGAPDDGAPTHIVTESQNISASGVYCLSPHYLAPLSKVALTIVLPRIPGARSAKELIKCEGIVVRCEQTTRRGERPYQVVCMFSDLGDDLRQRIDAFVTWRNLQALRAAARATPRSARARAKSGRGAVAAPTRSSTGTRKAAKRRTV